jgi:septal ring factor EnvC (AmiA/AmiB activator)
MFAVWANIPIEPASSGFNVPALCGSTVPALRRHLPPTRILALIALAALAVLATSAGRQPAQAATPSLGRLHSQLGAQQARQHSLNSSISSLNQLIGSLDSQISLVQSREAAVSDDLATDRAELTRVQASLARERIRLTKLRHRLANAKRALARQLVASYETDKPDLISVVLNAHGFNDLLDELDFLGRVEQQQQTIIAFTRNAKAQADAAALRLAKLQQTDRLITAQTELRVRALAGMNALLQSKQSALQSARAAQQDALEVSQAKGHDLQKQISHVQAQQAAAEAAAQRAAANPIALGPSGGWAIPYAIVLCESGGQNLPPNSAGASGYYQIIPSTWRLFDGTGPAAYLASKAEQDAVATRIWNGGAGAQNWVCAGIVGIHDT